MTYEEKKAWLGRYREAEKKYNRLSERLAEAQTATRRITQNISAIPGGAGDGQSLAHAAEFRGQTFHVVINYRGKVNRTFAVSASAVLEYMNTQTRKSIPWQWAALNGIEVEQRLLRVHWRYDVEGLLKKLEGDHAGNGRYQNMDP